MLQASAPPTTTSAAGDSSGGQSGPSQTTTAAPDEADRQAHPLAGRPGASPRKSAASTATKSGSVLASTADRPAPAWSIPQKTAP